MNFKLATEEASPPLQNTDHDLRGRVLRVLAQCGHTPLRRVKVEVQAGVVSLSGVLPSFYLRQLAIASASNVPGVLQVIDGIEAVPRARNRVLSD